MAARDAMANGWNASPVSPARLCAELWSQIKNEDWSYVSQSTFLSNWPQRTCDFTKTYQGIGVSGGGGVGYQMPAAVGAALAHKGSGRLVVNIVGDGELLTTAATSATERSDKETRRRAGDRAASHSTLAQIKNPAPPMPKLYPTPLSAGDVNDVAAYVQSL